MSDKTIIELPDDIQQRIGQEADNYANVTVGDPAKFTEQSQHLKWGCSSEDWEAGATAYATQLHEANERERVLIGEISALKAGAAEYYMQHNYRELYGLLQRVFEIVDTAALEQVNKKEDKQ